jgi:hypothetical protein
VQGHRQPLSINVRCGYHAKLWRNYQVLRGTIVHVFVASPSDVEPQRETVRKLIYEWNNDHSKNGVLVEPILWETHSHAAMGAHPQKIIDRQLLDQYDCDVLIGIFHARLGIATDTHASGTLEEIEYFSKKKAANKSQLLLFFCQWDISWNTDTAQRDKVDAFRTQAQQWGVCPVITEREKFEPVVRSHLNKLLSEIADSVKEPSTQVLGGAEVLSLPSDPSEKTWKQRRTIECGQRLLRLCAHFKQECDMLEASQLDRGKSVMGAVHVAVVDTLEEYQNEVSGSRGQAIGEIALGLSQFCHSPPSESHEFWAQSAQLFHRLKSIASALEI